MSNTIDGFMQNIMINTYGEVQADSGYHVAVEESALLEAQVGRDRPLIQRQEDSL